MYWVKTSQLIRHLRSQVNKKQVCHYIFSWFPNGCSWKVVQWPMLNWPVVYDHARLTSSNRWRLQAVWYAVYIVLLPRTKNIFPANQWLGRWNFVLKSFQNCTHLGEHVNFRGWVLRFCYSKSIFECLYLGRDYKVTYQAAVTPVTSTLLVVTSSLF